MDNQPQVFGQSPYLVEDEISLIDLAKIFVKRRKWFYAVFIGILCLGLALVLTRSKKVDYTTFYDLPQHVMEGKLKTMEPAAVITEKIKNIYLPALNGQYKKKNGKGLPVGVEIGPKNSKESSYLYFQTITTKTRKKQVIEVHKALLSELQKQQDLLYDQKKQYLQVQLSEAQKSLTMVQKEDVSQFLTRIASLKEQLGNLKKGMVVALVQEKEAKSKKMMYLAVVVVAAFVLGFIAVFIVEFVSQVREELQKES